MKRHTSVETQARILSAAKRLFAAHGYQRTTIRSVAAEAAIDPSMVMRYFQNKEKLFKAATSFDLELPNLGKLDRQNLGRAMVAHFLKRWETKSDMQLLLRSAATHNSAAKRMHDIFQLQLVPFIKRYCAMKKAEQCAALVATQMIGLAFLRYVLKYPEVTAMPHDFIEEKIGATIQAYLDTL
ncbi:MAG TPA: TetR family transcriptional regulator [Bryobacteraceae bacterium]|jgi:AcrR family transcriptional regulator|nr:TetR family transcriptional regulator [Bryobacteraceae bacterium]